LEADWRKDGSRTEAGRRQAELRPEACKLHVHCRTVCSGQFRGRIKRMEARGFQRDAVADFRCVKKLCSRLRGLLDI
jgi:hypothetical protein